MKTRLTVFQEQVLKRLANRIDDFYLAGGTALSLFYFKHRKSLDLDFFTQDFKKVQVMQIIRFLSENLHKKIELIAEQSRKDRIKILMYSVPVDNKRSLKLDFVQDYHKLIKPVKSVNGIKVLSLEDIYIRKIYAATGTFQREDIIGARMMTGGRQEAKDFYDLYCLSKIFMKLSHFSFKYGNQLMREAIIRWFRTYSRLDMKIGILELKLKKDIDYNEMERHFNKEINVILEREVELV